MLSWSCRRACWRQHRQTWSVARRLSVSTPHTSKATFAEVVLAIANFKALIEAPPRGP